MRGEITVSLFGLSENQVTNQMTVPFEILPDEAKLVTFLDEFGQFRKDTVLAAEVRNENGEILAQNIDYVDIERHLDFPTDCGISARWEEDCLILSSERFARSVELTGEEDGDEFGWLFEDNYFDLLPGTEKHVKLYTEHKKGVITVKPYYNDEAVEVSFVR